MGDAEPAVVRLGGHMVLLLSAGLGEGQRRPPESHPRRGGELAVRRWPDHRGQRKSTAVPITVDVPGRVSATTAPCRMTNRRTAPSRRASMASLASNTTQFAGLPTCKP